MCAVVGCVCCLFCESFCRNGLARGYQKKNVEADLILKREQQVSPLRRRWRSGSGRNDRFVEGTFETDFSGER